MRSCAALVLLVGVAAFAPPQRPQHRPAALAPRAAPPQFGRGTVRMQLSVGDFLRFPLTARFLRLLGVLPPRRTPARTAAPPLEAVRDYAPAAAEAQRLQEEAMRRAEERKIEQAREWAMRAISESKPKRAPPPASVVRLASPAKVVMAASSAPASAPIATASEAAAVTASEIAAAVAAVPMTAEPTVVAIEPKAQPKKKTKHAVVPAADVMTDEDADDYVRRTNKWWFNWARARSRSERAAAYSD